MCKLSIIDKDNRMCAKYRILCDGTDADIKRCPDWAILKIVQSLNMIAEEISFASNSANPSDRWPEGFKDD